MSEPKHPIDYHKIIKTLLPCWLNHAEGDKSLEDMHKLNPSEQEILRELIKEEKGQKVQESN